MLVESKAMPKLYSPAASYCMQVAGRTLIHEHMHVQQSTEEA